VRRPAGEIKGTGRSARAPDPVDALVGSNIRLQRIAKSMSQGELGERLGITAQQVQKYERGANRITAGRLIRLTEIFDVPLMTLFDGAEGSGASSDASFLHLIADRRAFRLAQAYAQIDAAGLRGRDRRVGRGHGAAGRNIVGQLERSESRGPCLAARALPDFAHAQSGLRQLRRHHSG
jgi:transcriptional regulator with XRE-family HTH domain